jgi:hypothetical protein
MVVTTKRRHERTKRALTAIRRLVCTVAAIARLVNTVLDWLS